MPWELVIERYGVARFQLRGVDASGPCHYFIEQVGRESPSPGGRRVRGTIDVRGQGAALESLASALDPAKTVDAVLHLGEVRLRAWAVYLEEAELLDFGSFDRAGIERLIGSQ